MRIAHKLRDNIMAIDREIWVRGFTENDIPRYPCPKCRRGHIQPESEALLKREPAYSIQSRPHEAWDPDWIVERFSLLMKCDIPTCGELVFAIGRTSMEEYYDDELDTFAYQPAFYTAAMFPAPPIISIPKDTPRSVSALIKHSFALFWSDLDACANKVRASLEQLLTELKVPAHNKKSHPLNLNSRIELFGKATPEHKETFHALRLVGNIGSHEGKLDQDIILDAYELYEHTLSEIIGRRSETLKAMRAQLIASATKGKSATSRSSAKKPNDQDQ